MSREPEARGEPFFEDPCRGDGLGMAELDDADLALLEAAERPFREEAQRHRLRGTVVGIAILSGVLALAAYPPERIAIVAAILALSSLAIGLYTRGGRSAKPPYWIWFAPLLVVAVTGGVRSPIFPAAVFGLAPYLFVASRRERTGRWIWMGAAVFAILTLLPEAIAGPPFAPPIDALLTGISLVIALVKVGTIMRRSRLVDHLVENEIRRLRGDLLHEAHERSRTFEAVAAKVGHELKTPLSAIRVLLDLEHRRAADPTTQERLSRALGEVQRLSAIVNDYLVLAKPIEALEMDEYDLGAVTLDVATMFRPSTTRAGIALQVNTPTGPVRTVGDRRRVREALMNLVANAIEASSSGQAVHVTLEADADRVSVTVRDEGKGIPAHLLPRIGTAFFTTREGGTGLGIVLSRMVVMQHGGRLSFDSVEGRGTAVNFWMPRDVQQKEVSGVRPTEAILEASVA